MVPVFLGLYVFLTLSCLLLLLFSNYVHGFAKSQTRQSLMSTELVMPSNHLILCCSLLLLPPSFPASGSFPKSQLFTSGGQSIGTSASESDWKSIKKWLNHGSVNFLCKSQVTNILVFADHALCVATTQFCYCRRVTA